MQPKIPINSDFMFGVQVCCCKLVIRISNYSGFFSLLMKDREHFSFAIFFNHFFCLCSFMWIKWEKKTKQTWMMMCKQFVCATAIIKFGVRFYYLFFRNKMRYIHAEHMQKMNSRLFMILSELTLNDQNTNETEYR